MRDFIEMRLEMLSNELAETIQHLEEICHSPHELSFVAGRVFQLQGEIEKLRYYLTQEE